MTAGQLCRRLRTERVVPLATAEWERLAAEFQEVERHRAMPAGDLLVLEYQGQYLAVEEPSPGQSVVRWLADREEARRFVGHRLAQYDRMWDGCGCKIDYFGRDWER
jgi:hypothetical protein